MSPEDRIIHEMNIILTLHSSPGIIVDTDGNIIENKVAWKSPEMEKAYLWLGELLGELSRSRKLRETKAYARFRDDPDH